jgi:hypothetical protein
MIAASRANGPVDYDDLLRSGHPPVNLPGCIGVA